MKKYLFIAASAALALSSCSSDEATVQEPITEGDVLSFDTYMGSNARVTEVLNLGVLQSKGFGVFAYDQGTSEILSYVKGNIKPNFMLNEQVKWNSSTEQWEYSPVKYWPNNVNNMLSFYAYAPFDANVKTITHNPHLVQNSIYNGPAIEYVIPSTLEAGVDLCWGANATIDIATPSADGETAPVNYYKNPSTGAAQHVSTNGKIKFNFKHATSRLDFNLQIFNDLLTDGNGHGTPANGGFIDEHTTISVKSLKLIGNVASKGVLSLYDGSWDAQYETQVLDLTPYLNDAVKGNMTDNAYATEQPMFKENEYLYIIPGANYRIQIEYWVKTDAGDDTDNSTLTKNTITSEVVFDAEQGKAYKYHLNLGMTTVKFDAELTDWGTENDTEVDLPNNTQFLTAAANYKYDDNYQYNGNVAVDGNTITTTYTSAALAADQTILMNDLARILGGLYRAGGVTTIEYAGGTYKWDTEGTLKGSNWKLNGTGATLVSQIVAYFQANPSTTQITLKCNGVDMIFKYATTA